MFRSVNNLVVGLNGSDVTVFIKLFLFIIFLISILVMLSTNVLMLINFSWFIIRAANKLLRCCHFAKRYI